MTDRTYRDDPYEYMSQDPCDYCPYHSTDKCDEDNCSGMIMIDADQFDELPTVEERQHGDWIPCEYRLPEENGRFLVFLPDRNGTFMCADFLSGKWYPDDYECTSNHVIAWMPLPEPYEERR